MTSVPPAERRCTSCNLTKPLTDFYRNKTKPAGREARCKTCFLAAQKGELPPKAAHPERFWEKVSKDTGCWEWQAARYPTGYGMYMLKKRPRYAHRIAYELAIGPIPPGLEIDHLCRNRSCVRPDHLEPVTKAENILRSESPPAQSARATECPNGHPWDAANTYWYRGWRHCKACRRETNRAWAEKKQNRHKVPAGG